MFFELSKDKSLLNVLRKVDLDNNTRKLVKEGASLSSIRKSLFDNMNPSNVTAYRRYIQKADDEEEQKKKEEEARRREEARREAGDVSFGEEQSVSAAQQEERRISSEKKRAEAQVLAERNASQDRYKKINKAKKDLRILEKNIRDLKSITDNVNFKEGQRIRLREYERMVGPNKAEGQKLSTGLIYLMKKLKKNNNFLVELFKPLTENVITYSDKRNKQGERVETGKKENQLVPLRRKGSNRKGNLSFSRNERAAIDIPAIQEKLLEYANMTFDGDKDIVYLLTEMHKRKYGRTPLTNRKDTYMALMAYSKGLKPKIKAGFKKAKKNIKDMRRYLKSLNSAKNDLEQTIESLTEVRTDAEQILERRLKEINDVMKVQIRMGRAKKNNPAQVKRIQNKIKEFMETVRLAGYEVPSGPFGFKITESGVYSPQVDSDLSDLSKIVDEVTKDLDDELEEAKLKLEELIQDTVSVLEDGTGFKEILTDYSSLIARISDSDDNLLPIGESSFKILMKANTKISTLTTLCKKISAKYIDYAENAEESLIEAINNIDMNNLEDAFKIDDTLRDMASDSEMINNFNELKKEVIEIIEEAQKEFAQFERQARMQRGEGATGPESEMPYRLEVLESEMRSGEKPKVPPSFKEQAMDRFF